MTVTDIAVGEVAAAVLRGAVSLRPASSRVITALGLVPSWWALLAIPARGPDHVRLRRRRACWWRRLMREFHHHQYMQLVMLPMFLFATTFYPLSVYPKPLQPVVAVLPLYQATELLRGLTLGRARPGHAGGGGVPARAGRSSGCGWPTAAWRGCC